MVIFKFGLQASWRQLEFLVAPRRIGFPAAAGRTVPVELPCLESAVLAMVARQALRMAVYEIADELQIVAPFGGRDQQLRFEQLVQAVPRPFRARVRRFRERELAIVIRDFLLRGLPGVLFQLERDADGLHPVLFLLIDLEHEFQRLGAMRRALELEKHLFRAIEEPGLEVVLPQLDHRVQPLLPAQIRTFEQVPMHANRALGLAAAAEQAPQGEVQLDRLRVDLDHLDESLDRLVGLLVEQEVETLEVRARQLPRFPQELLDVDARREPAQPEEQGEPEQPPELEVHGESGPTPAAAKCGCPPRAARARACGSRGAARAGAAGRREPRSRRRRRKRGARPRSSGSPRSVRGRSAASPDRYS